MRLAEMQHLRQGIPVYAPASAERFDAMIYGPLYYLLGSRLIDPEQPAYFPLRLVSLLSVLGCAAVAAWLAFRISGCKLAAACAPLCFLSYAFVSVYGIAARADGVALFLSFGGVIAAYRFRETPTLLLSVPLFLLSLFYKQQFVAAPLAVFFFLLLEKRYRLAAAFAGLMAAGGGGLLAFFQFVIFRGQDFFLHFFNYNLVPFSWARFEGALISFAIVFLVPLLVATESLRVHRDKFMACYLACSVGFAILALGKQGSDANYLLECIFPISVLFASLLARRIGESASVLDLPVLLLVTLFTGQFFVPPPPSQRDFERDRAIQLYLRGNFPPGTRALGYYAGDLIRAGLDVPIADIYQRTWLTRTGALDERQIVDQLVRHKFKVIVLDFDLQMEKETYWTENYLTAEMRRTIQAEYRLLAVLEMPVPERFAQRARFYVWVPRSDVQPVAPATSEDTGAWRGGK